jgi:hypothetical protein
VVAEEFFGAGERKKGNPKKKSQPNKGKVGTDWCLQHSSSEPLDVPSSITHRTARNDKEELAWPFIST